MQLLSVTELCCTLLRVGTQQSVSMERWELQDTSGTVRGTLASKVWGRPAAKWGKSEIVKKD